MRLAPVTDTFFESRGSWEKQGFCEEISVSTAVRLRKCPLRELPLWLKNCILLILGQKLDVWEPLFWRDPLVRLRAVSLFSWSVEQNARDTQITTRVTEGARRERHDARVHTARSLTPSGYFLVSDHWIFAFWLVAYGRLDCSKFVMLPISTDQPLLSLLFEIITRKWCINRLFIFKLPKRFKSFISWCLHNL